MDITRRDLIDFGTKLLVLASVGATLEQITGAEPAPDAYKMADHWWGMLIDIDKCIGCGNCVRACAKENNVPDGYFRTWVERYADRRRTSSPRSTRPTAAWTASRSRHPSTSRASSSPSSATTASIRPASRSARSAPPSSAPTASCSWTRATASAAATACRPARTAAATSSREADGRQVHALLPPHHPGTDDRLLRELPDRRAPAGRFQESQGPDSRIPASTTRSRS